MYRIYLLIYIFPIVLGVKDGLYSTEDDDVSPLNNETFSTKVLKNHSDVIWTVEFYNSWCGHCVHFAPTYKNVAKDLKDWRDLVVIAAIDCSQPRNLETCRVHDIISYPTVKMFPPTSIKDGKIEIIKSQDLQTIKNTILDFMVKSAPESWPHLQPLKKIEDIWQEKKDVHDHVVFIFEEAESPVGSQVILDLRHTPNVLVRRMLKDSVTKFGITKFPSLYLINPDSTYTQLAVGSKMLADDRAAFVKKVKSLADGKKVKDFKQNEKSLKQQPGHGETHPDKVSLPLKSKSNISVVNMQDLESALHYSFRQEVAIRKVIDGERFQALKKYVDVLLKYFPGRKPVLGFLNKVYEMLNSLKSENISGEEWLKKIDNLQDKDNYLPAVIKWESCQGSSPRYRGYPCSMWTLFHTLTVAAYNQNLGIRHNIPQEVLAAIRGYMEFFFGCQECSKNFLQMARSIEEEVHSQKDSVLWLWSAHNKANKRLHEDVSEDPQHPKIQFPSDKMCPQCHSSVATDSGTKSSWDTEKVLEFLVNFYSERSIAFPKDPPEDNHNANFNSSDNIKERDWWERMLQEPDLEQIQWLRDKKRDIQSKDINRKTEFRGEIYYSTQNESSFFRLWGLTQIDFSLCVVFYLLSTIVILGLYHHFIVRRRMMPCKSIIS